MALKVLHSYLLHIVLHRMSISSFSKRFLKKWLAKVTKRQEEEREVNYSSLHTSTIKCVL